MPDFPSNSFGLTTPRFPAEPMADPAESPSLSSVPQVKPAIGTGIQVASSGLPTPHVEKQQDMRREKFMNLLNEDVGHTGFKLT